MAKKTVPAKRAPKRMTSVKPVKTEELTSARALAILKPRLQELPAKGLVNLRADIGAAALAAQAVSKKTLSGELHGRFEKMASIGEFDLDALELLQLAGLAAQEARQNADRALAKGAHSKMPLALIKDASLVEHRMQSACEHTLAKLDDAKIELARLAPGQSYRDLADDLVGYAALYDQYSDDVKKDGINFDAGDPKLARALARKIYDVLGDDLTQRDQAALDTLARAWTYLLDIYARVAAVGRFLERNNEVGSTFPSLYAVARPGSGRPKKPAPASTPAAS